MKKLLVMLTVFCLLSIAGVSNGFAAQLVWDANPATDNVDKYPEVIPNSWVFIAIPDGSYTARVRAHNMWDWGAWSDPLPFDKSVPGVPVGIRLEAEVP
jgi:hypothetical protein